MNIRIVNWSGEKKVEEAFREYGLVNGTLYGGKDDEALRTLFEYFVFEKSLDCKIIRKERRIQSEKSDSVLSEVVVIVDNKGFAKRNPRSSVRLGEKKSRGPVKEYGTKRYDVVDVLSHISKRHRMRPIKKDFDGDMIKMNSLRLRTFKEKGCTCVSCGLEGTYFLKVRNNPLEGWHFNLYGDCEKEVDGEIEVKSVLFTKDHIRPKSKGGEDSIDNMQTMCVNCNTRKGNDFVLNA